MYFYPRPPRGGRLDLSHPCPPCSRYFYPRPPRGGRLSAGHGWNQQAEISIHALREEGDTRICEDCGVVMEFLSTPSARRATRYLLLAATNICISIHALREEGDDLRDERPDRHHPISIHALREEGDYSLVRVSMCIIRFLSTPSARRATPDPCRDPGISEIFLSTPSARRATL